ncbi:MAG: S46 family peptidase [Bacteroidales bacterium]|nr:S46 family peptidase [Bacteroidales bacterium]
MHLYGTGLQFYHPLNFDHNPQNVSLNFYSRTLPVNFLSNNDITGGNSGSPVLNAKGELIGLAFDGNKESLCSDAYFHPDYCKTVSVDIRYVLWILKYYAEADHILQELEF